jgi:flagellar basal-body rod protein FlgB
MLEKIAQDFSYNATSLKLRAERQQLLVSNIANAETPGYKSVDFDFATAMRQAQTDQTAASQYSLNLAQTHEKHFVLDGMQGLSTALPLQYVNPYQPSIDGNTVDLDAERSKFAENTLRYEVVLNSINSDIREFQTVLQPN